MYVSIVCVVYPDGFQKIEPLYPYFQSFQTFCVHNKVFRVVIFLLGHLQKMSIRILH